VGNSAITTPVRNDRATSQSTSDRDNEQKNVLPGRRFGKARAQEQRRRLIGLRQLSASVTVYRLDLILERWHSPTARVTQQTFQGDLFRRASRISRTVLRYRHL
jgi:hypothetical protein